MKSLSIATWNIENLSDSNSDLWNKRKPVLKEILDRAKTDILLLQEVHSIAALKELIQGTHYENHHISHTTKADGAAYAERNLVVLSKFNISDTKQYRNTLTDKPKWRRITADPVESDPIDIGWERPILHCTLDLAGTKKINIINLHLKSFPPTDIPGQKHSTQWYKWLSHKGWAEGYYISDIKRVGQALETRVLLDQIFSSDLHALIAVGGDFNAEIGSIPFKAIVGSVQDTSNVDLRDTVLIPCEMNIPPDQRYSLLHHGKGNMIDHVIVSKEFYPHWTETKIFNELLKDESIAFATDDKFPESDHAPVIAHFAVPDNCYHKLFRLEEK